MSDIVTVTLNPALDISTSVDRVVDTRKLRCSPARRDPGGGGINVARVITRLGGRCAAVYLAGGSPGQALEQLLVGGLDAPPRYLVISGSLLPSVPVTAYSSLARL